MENNPFKKVWTKKNLFNFILSISSLLFLFSLFLPYAYTLNGNQNLSFIKGYEIFRFRSDTGFLHYIAILYAFSLVISQLLFLIPLFSCFSKEESKKVAFRFEFVLSLFQVVSEVIAVCLLSQCSKMLLYVEFGSIVSAVAKGLLFLFICYVFLRNHQYSKTKAS